MERRKMNCPDCELELKVTKTHTEVAGDKAVMVQELSCINPACKMSSREAVETIRHELG
ncbi:MAG: hypothetical protein GX222_07830 [Ruminococcaceae bacterium]|nr:hypothetical protein [Oscillospiraceae bacterium]